MSSGHKTGEEKNKMSRGVEEEDPLANSSSSMTSMLTEDTSNHHILSVPWANDKMSPYCHLCTKSFNLFRRRHHCRFCGKVFCKPCTNHKLPMSQFDLLSISGAVTVHHHDHHQSPRSTSEGLEEGLRIKDVAHMKEVEEEENDDKKFKSLKAQSQGSCSSHGSNTSQRPRRSPATRPTSPKPHLPPPRQSHTGGGSVQHNLSRSQSHNTLKGGGTSGGTQSPDPRQMVRVCITCFQLCKLNVDMEWDDVSPVEITTPRLSPTVSVGGGGDSPDPKHHRVSSMQSTANSETHSQTKSPRGGQTFSGKMSLLLGGQLHHSDPTGNNIVLLGDTTSSSSAHGAGHPPTQHHSPTGTTHSTEDDTSRSEPSKVVVAGGGVLHAKGGTVAASKCAPSLLPAPTSKITASTLAASNKLPQENYDQIEIRSPLHHLTGLPETEELDLTSLNLQPVASTDLSLTDTAAAHKRSSRAAAAAHDPHSKEADRKQKHQNIISTVASIALDTAKESGKVIKGATAGVLGATAVTVGTVGHTVTENTVGLMRNDEDARSRQTRENTGVLVWGGNQRTSSVGNPHEGGREEPEEEKKVIPLIPLLRKLKKRQPSGDDQD